MYNTCPVALWGGPSPARGRGPRGRSASASDGGVPLQARFAPRPAAVFTAPTTADCGQRPPGASEKRTRFFGTKRG
eukprot:6325783-Pyramimonas_sp.AAC.1